MVTLIQSNKYLRDPAKRRQMLADNARHSSIFEGARLPIEKPAAHARGSSRRAIASAKKSVSKP